MKVRVLWSIAAALTVVALLLASCGPRVIAPTPTTPPPTSTPAATPTPAAPAPAPAAPTLVEKPKYGGTINIVERRGTGVWDNVAVPQATDRGGAELVYESLQSFDWTRGKAGSGKVNWALGVVGLVEDYSGQLAESWETPEVGTWVLNIRKGVHFALNPASEASRLMNGREMTADDVVWNITRHTKTPSTTTRSNPAMSKALTVEKTGPWEVTVKIPVNVMNGWHWVIYGGNAQHIWPREVVEKYGNAQDWHNAVGTGPFMVTDFIPDSITTVIRNPNYWDKDPIGPGKGNQLPYVDTFKTFIIPDLSTRLAAMRTGKADWTTEVEGEDARSLIRTSPNLKYEGFLSSSASVLMRMDKADLPFKDKRVRQAMMMAIDYESLKRDLYQGDAEIYTRPIPPTYPDLFVPMEKLPEVVQALYKYNPERAKQLLAEAGYPNGFKTKMIVQNISSELDPASAMKAMWAKVGIDVEIQPRETAVYSSISTAKSHEEMFMGSSGTQNMIGTYTLGSYRSERVSGTLSNARIDDRRIDEVSSALHQYLFVNFPKANQMIRDLVPYIIEQTYTIERPAPYSYTLWQPWLKNHYGEYRPKMWARYAWIDQDLKEKMTGRR